MSEGEKGKARFPAMALRPGYVTWSPAERARASTAAEGSREVDRPRGQVGEMRTRLPVGGVGGHRGHRAHLVGIGWLDDERALLHEAEQAVGAVAGIGGGSATLEDLPHVNDEAGVEARA